MVCQVHGGRAGKYRVGDLTETDASRIASKKPQPSIGCRIHFEADCPAPCRAVMSHISCSAIQTVDSATRSSGPPLTASAPHRIGSSCSGSTPSTTMRIQAFWICQHSATASDHFPRGSRLGRAFRRAGSETCSNTAGWHTWKAQGHHVSGQRG